MPKTSRFIVGGILVAFAVGAAWIFFQRSASAPLPLALGDSVASWDFRGVYLDGGTLEDKARSEIARLKNLLGSGEFTDYEIYVSIANQYELLGDGGNAYAYLGKAIREDSADNTGLAWYNLGVLLSRLGALQTARIAYEKATLIEPQISFYHYAYIEFLIQNMKNDTAAIEKAFTAAAVNFGQTSDMTDLRARWEKS